MSVLEIVHSSENSTTGSILPQLESAEDILDTINYTVVVQNEKSVGIVESQLGALKDLVSLEVRGTEKDAQDSERQFDLVLVFKAAQKDPDLLLREAKTFLKESGRVCVIEMGKPLLDLGIRLAALQQTW